MKKEEFIQIVSKYIDLNNYEIRFKKSPYYKNENEMWLYKKDDEGVTKKIISGYESNGKFYKSLKQLRETFSSGRNEYRKCYQWKKRRIGLLIKEEDLSDEEYLNIALNG